MCCWLCCALAACWDRCIGLVTDVWVVKCPDESCAPEPYDVIIGVYQFTCNHIFQGLSRLWCERWSIVRCQGWLRQYKEPRAKAVARGLIQTCNTSVDRISCRGARVDPDVVCSCVCSENSTQAPQNSQPNKTRVTRRGRDWSSRAENSRKQHPRYAHTHVDRATTVELN